MRYVVDTVALIRHFTNQGKIGKGASIILQELERSGDTLFVSVISLMEILYLAEKNRIDINLKETLSELKSSSCFTVVDLNTEILLVAENLRFSELHDRLILATAKWLDVPIISSDRKFKHIPDVQVIWK